MVLPFLEDKVQVALSEPATIVRRRRRSFLVFLKSQCVVLDRLLVVASFVLAGTASIRSVHVVRVQLQHAIVVCNRLINSTLFFVGAPTHVVCATVLRVELHQIIAVLDGLL